MKNLRIYGNAPFNVAVIHGGPGAPGSMAPVARELAVNRGVLEPLQTASSLDGQVLELKRVLDENADLPVTLIGSSWGAWLSFIFSARYPGSTKKIILVGSGPFEEKYAANIMETRLNRFNEDERKELHSLTAAFNNPTAGDRNALLTRLGELSNRTDTLNPLTLDTEVLECQYDIHIKVWEEARALRSNGRLLELGKQIKCPVTALHGDYDPHPFKGVREPLSSILKEFKFFLLKNCGHYPWLEREAKERFFELLNKEII